MKHYKRKKIAKTDTGKYLETSVARMLGNKKLRRWLEMGY